MNPQQTKPMERDTAWRVLDVVLSVAVTISCSVMGWIVTEHIRLDNRVVAIEANRFTPRDALEIWREIAELKRDISTVPREVPPAWFLKRVDDIDEKLEAIESRLNFIEKLKP